MLRLVHSSDTVDRPERVIKLGLIPELYVSHENGRFGLVQKSKTAGIILLPESEANRFLSTAGTELQALSRMVRQKLLFAQLPRRASHERRSARWLQQVHHELGVDVARPTLPLLHTCVNVVPTTWDQD